MTDQAPAPSADRVALVSGTSSGIGFATALALAKAGWRTVATMRNLERASALKDAAAAASVELDIRELDVTDADSVSRAVDDITARYGRLDALVNNAGAASVGTVEQTELAEYRSTMELNYFGVVQLTKAALPQLRAAGGRLVTVTSVGGVVGQPFNEAYCAAKFAVEGFMESLHPVAAAVGVRVSVIEPGAVASAFVTNLGLDTAAMLAAAGPYAPALRNYLDHTAKQFGSGAAQTPDDVAAIVVGCLDAPNPAFRLQTSEWSGTFVGTKLADSDGSRVTEMTATWVS